jgi:hypothetical protein
MLNQWSRRGFLGGAVFLCLLVKSVAVRAAWQLAGATPPVSVPAALGFVRQFNTVQAARSDDDKVPWLNLTETYQEIHKHKEHFKPGTLGYEWMSRFTPFAEEIFPGWKIDFALVKYSTGYRLVLRGERYCFITDERHMIYEANTPTSVPKAASLSSAAAFPGAVPHDLFHAEPTASRGGRAMRVKRSSSVISMNA